MFKKAFTLAELSLIFFIMAILAVLFYRTLKPDNIVYNNLYYAAYTNLSNAFYEVVSEEPFDVDKFVDAFFKHVNVTGSSSSLNNQEGVNFNEEVNANYEIPNVFESNFSFLTNGMQIRFDKISYIDAEKNPAEILVATVDINGNNNPNEYNKDRIQFEINENGVFPIGDIETNNDLLKFNIISRYGGEVKGGIAQLLTGDPRIIKYNKSYQDAACLTGFPRHTYFQKKEGRGCGALTILDECNKNDLKCEIEAVKP